MLELDGGLITVFFCFTAVIALSFGLRNGTNKIIKFGGQHKPKSNPKGNNRQTHSQEKEDIQPVNENFNWETEQPLRYIPMKPGGYKMTMGLKKLSSPQDQFLIDRTYLNKTNVRAKLTEERGAEFIFCQKEGEQAVLEYYDYVIGFMLKRYPMCFVLCNNGQKVLNKIRNEMIPCRSIQFNGDALKALYTLARNVEDDVVILLKDQATGTYVLRAGIFLLPSGFAPINLLGKNLAGIHGPVPQYREKLEFAMDKFFNRVQVDQFVYRVNWSIQTHSHINDIGLNHGKKGVTPIPLQAAELDFNKVFLRSERQVLTRLPKSQAVIMTIKTYFTPLIKLRDDEEQRKLLSENIEKLSGDLAIYKNKLKWEKAVMEYLRYNSNGSINESQEYLFQD